jgi:hypothetical protein
MIKTNYRLSVYIPSELATTVVDTEGAMVMPISTMVRTTVAKEINRVYGKLQQNTPLKRSLVTKERSYRSRKDAMRIVVVLPAVYRERFAACYTFHQERFVAELANKVTAYIQNF